MSDQGRIIAIGDIHGCRTALEHLLHRLRLNSQDQLIILGDVVDRGPDSCGVVTDLLQLQERYQVTCLLGNHEQMLLDAIEGRIPRQQWLGFGGSETLDSYRNGAPTSVIPEAHIEFIRSWGDYYETDAHFFAHGNYRADLPLAEQPWDELRWISLAAYTPGPHRSGKTAILGHTSNKQGEVVNLGHLVCVDTYCHGGGWLTALDTTTGRLWQANEQGVVRTEEVPPIRSSAASEGAKR